MGVRWAGLVNHPHHTHHRHKHCHTRSDKRGSAHTHLSVDQSIDMISMIRDSLQQHSQATLSLRECLSLSRHHLIYTSTHSHTQPPHTTAVYLSLPLSLFSCHETVSLRARNAVSSTVSQSPQHVSPAVFVTGRLQNFPPILRWGACVKSTTPFLSSSAKVSLVFVCLWRFFPYFACI